MATLFVDVLLATIPLPRALLRMIVIVLSVVAVVVVVADMFTILVTELHPILVGPCDRQLP